MTEEQKALLEIELRKSIDLAGTLASVIAPSSIVHIVLGQAIAGLIPTLFLTVEAMLANREPTDTDVADLMAKLEALEKNPGSI
jgi:hypothetical protein